MFLLKCTRKSGRSEQFFKIHSLTINKLFRVGTIIIYQKHENRNGGKGSDPRFLPRDLKKTKSPKLIDNNDELSSEEY